MNIEQAVKLEKAMRVLYSHKGYKAELIYNEKSILVGLFSKDHEARICIGLVAEDPRSFSKLEKLWDFDRQDLEGFMVDVFEMLDQENGDPWLCDVSYDCLTIYEHAYNQVLCRLHVDIDDDMEV